jgi:hypothetical protein
MKERYEKPINPRTIRSMSCIQDTVHKSLRAGAAREVSVEEVNVVTAAWVRCIFCNIYRDQCKIYAATVHDPVVQKSLDERFADAVVTIATPCCLLHNNELLCCDSKNWLSGVRGRPAPIGEITAADIAYGRREFEENCKTLEATAKRVNILAKTGIIR